MGLHRVAQKLERELKEHERGTRDGFAPVAEANRVFVGLLEEDVRAVRRAIALEEKVARFRTACDAVLDTAGLMRATLLRNDAHPLTDRERALEVVTKLVGAATALRKHLEGES